MSVLIEQFKQSFKYTGRLSVSDFRRWSAWLLLIFILTYIAHLYAVHVLDNYGGSSINAVTGVFVFYATLLLVYVFLMFAIMSALIRRHHDMGRNGWFSVLWFVPYIGVGYWIYLLCAKGTQGPNAYGPPA
ncbi:hypothetical protein WSS15_22350 [Acetobacter pasteurianus]|uniref:DUF805 domain-containing protein n=3 Tax=Acetobacter pasteurianus TaxID=438 RepID=C7JDJ2_ACEP3|nr:DUF805 domain-containing protein [Acetobacter pasteurianus]ASC04987.1 hypothetical protein S101468_00719 [Acetobacter pasteurianus subsp. pasteurianus]BAH98636.1 hypothetical protein APA01_04860 [Acetobacter pasteurianus IFO 3283-01]BAI01687.1 hypothetical protein APA03_04860 [Acetobacter pasteurianus IFO 3283-03]BAI04735.1 hypothetical protein APA07_04860 [Acetobacter pasteurianus IFO 3283-07]BAI07782.1 hypothetical protein APA22_04860 [Acetobacter pasteurianus IFO 3283-22]